MMDREKQNILQALSKSKSGAAYLVRRMETLDQN